MRIGELAKQLGMTTSKIRFLESRGLVHSSRLPNGYRDYDQELECPALFVPVEKR
jgi:MerR family transcriptional regulator, redox-sensitive transcriptional activator SoxR